MKKSIYDIFVSYSRLNENIVYPVVKELEKSGFKIWIDKDGVESGDAFKTVIVKAIENSNALVFFSSKESNDSPWITKEIAVAIYERKRIIPIRLDGAKYNSEIKFDLINLDYIEMTDRSQISDGTQRLIKSLGNIKSKDDAEKNLVTDEIVQGEVNLESDILDEKGATDNHKDKERRSDFKLNYSSRIKEWITIILFFFLAFGALYGICFGCGYYYTRCIAEVKPDMQVELLTHIKLSGPIITYDNNGILATYDAETKRIRNIQVNEQAFNIEGVDFLRAASISSGFTLWYKNMKVVKAKGKAGVAVFIGSFIGTLFGYSTGKYVAEQNNRSNYQEDMVRYLRNPENWIMCQKKYDERILLENL